MKKKYIIFFIFLITLYSCSRSENPFSPSKKEVLEIKKPQICFNDINTFDKTFNIRFFIYSSYYKNQPFNIVSAIGSWYGFQNLQVSENKYLYIEYLYEVGDIVYIAHSRISKEQLVGFIFNENDVPLPKDFVINSNDNYPPEILNVIGPNGGEFTREKPPEIYIIARETNQASGFTIPRYYVINFNDIYGNANQYFKVFKPVNIAMTFFAPSPYQYMWLNRTGEIVEEYPDGSVKIKVSFPPELWGTSEWHGFIKNEVYQLIDFNVFDIIGWGGYVSLSGSLYMQGSRIVGSNIIYFVVK